MEGGDHLLPRTFRHYREVTSTQYSFKTFDLLQAWMVIPGWLEMSEIVTKTGYNPR